MPPKKNRQSPRTSVRSDSKSTDSGESTSSFGSKGSNKSTKDGFQEVLGLTVPRIVASGPPAVPKAPRAEADANYLRAVNSEGRQGNTLQQLINRVDTNPYEELQRTYTDETFVSRVASSLEALIRYKYQRYETMIADLEARVAKDIRSMAGLTEKEEEDSPLRFTLSVNKQTLGRLGDLIDTADVYMSLFFETEQGPRPANRPGRFLDKNQFTYFQGIRNELVGTSKATGHQAFKAFVAKRLGIIMKSSRGFKLLEGPSRKRIRDAMASIVLSLGGGFQQFKTRFFNVVLMGDPGVGKSTLADAIGYIMGQMLIMFESAATKYTVSDFVAQYEGQSGAKTKQLLVQGLETVVFLDEAYGLMKCGSKSEGDSSYGLDSVNEMVNFMTDFQGLAMIIIAGYRKPMETCFLTANEGFNRRFDPEFRFVMEAYTAAELKDILQFRLRDSGLSLNETEVALINFFIDDTYSELFKNSASDVQAMIDYVSEEANIWYEPFANKSSDSNTSKLMRLVVLAKALDKFAKARVPKATVSYSVSRSRFGVVLK